jgi:hypothetical protein
MEKEFVPYELVLELKQLGFDIPSVSGYSYSDSDNLLAQAILYQQAFRWFREKYELYPEINLHDREDEQTWRFSIIILGEYNLVYNQNVVKNPYYKTYEEAELACLQKLIEIVKTK